jgi:pimeloyl-ACP methyl ester carboxylesterase
MKNITLIIAVLLFASCQKEKISLKTANEVFFLKEKGVSMPIKVYGNMASNKILLMVHGGPGGTSLGYRNKTVLETVETEFAVAFWDQRMAGTSQGSTTDDDINLYKNDLQKVIALLKARYGSDKKIYLLGHSWGGFLTPFFLEEGKNQVLVNGWIQVDGAHDYNLNDSLSKKMLLFYGKKEIANNRNKSQWQEITDYCNSHAYNESADVAFKINSYASSAENYLEVISTKPSNLNIVKSAIKTDRFAVTAQLSNLLVSAKIKKVDLQAYKIPITENLYKLKLPTLLLWGRYDFVCPIGLKDVIKKNIKSTDVSEKTFEQSGHSPMDNEPELFWSTVVDWVSKH